MLQTSAPPSADVPHPRSVALFMIFMVCLNLASQHINMPNLVNGRLCKGAYLGPEVASASHWVRVQLNTGEFRVVRSSKIRMIHYAVEV